MSMMRLWESLKWISTEAERFEEGIEPEFQDAEEEVPKDTNNNADLGTHGSGVSYGGFGSSSLQECLDRLNQTRVEAPAPCHCAATLFSPCVSPA